MTSTSVQSHRGEGALGPVAPVTHNTDASEQPVGDDMFDVDNSLENNDTHDGIVLHTVEEDFVDGPSTNSEVSMLNDTQDLSANPLSSVVTYGLASQLPMTSI